VFKFFVPLVGPRSLFMVFVPLVGSRSVFKFFVPSVGSTNGGSPWPTFRDVEFFCLHVLLLLSLSFPEPTLRKEIYFLQTFCSILWTGNQSTAVFFLHRSTQTYQKTRTLQCPIWNSNPWSSVQEVDGSKTYKVLGLCNNLQM
jgi:hypothetical protein